MTAAGERPRADGRVRAAGRSLAGRWAALRDQLIARPDFQRWAASFPLTRAVAERRARALFDLCAGFVYSQVLLACVRLDLFAMLAGGPLPSEAIASRTGLSLEATERLLRAAVALDLLELRGGNWALGPLGAVLPGNEALRAMVEHHALVYADLADPLALLRGERATGLNAYWPYAGGAPATGLGVERVAPYTRLMAESQALVRDDVLDAVALGDARHLLDVGGGDGGFAMAAVRRWPGLRATVFDLPAVATLARDRIAAAGLTGRIDAVGGDFLAGALPGGADVISLVRVLHDHEDPAVERLLAAARRALAPGGRLLVAEPMAGARGAKRVGDAYFAFYLLAMGSGRARTAADLGQLLSRAGFVAIRECRTRRPLQTGLIEARAG